MLLHPAPQKFNTFNTFTTFATFNPALEYPTPAPRNPRRLRSLLGRRLAVTPPSPSGVGGGGRGVRERTEGGRGEGKRCSEDLIRRTSSPGQPRNPRWRSESPPP